MEEEQLTIVDFEHENYQGTAKVVNQPSPAVVIDVEDVESLCNWQGKVKDAKKITDNFVETLNHFLILLRDAVFNEHNCSLDLSPLREALILTIYNETRFGTKEYEVKLEAVSLSKEDILEKGLTQLKQKINTLTPDSYRGKFKFDPNGCSANLTLFHNDTAVVNHTGGSHAGVLTTGYKKGVVYYEFRVIRTAESRGVIMIGVTNNYAPLATYPGQTPYGLSYYLHDGRVYHDSSSYTADGGNGRTGDYVGVLLNLNTRKVSWAVNGLKGKEWDLPEGQDEVWYFTVNCYDAREAVEILPHYCYHKPMAL